VEGLHPEIKIRDKKPIQLIFFGWDVLNKRINPKILNHINRNFVKLFTKAVIKAVNQLPPPWESNRKGRKGHDLRKVAVCCILKVAFIETYDGIESHVKDSEILKQYYDGLPGHSVIHRGMQKLSIKYIRKVMNRVIKSLRKKGMNIAVDSTGFSTKNSSKWYDIRIGRINTRKDCMKLHISIDVETGIIHWFVITDWKRHDSKEFENLVKKSTRTGKRIWR